MIPLSVPNLAGNEWKYIKECLDTNWVSSVGAYVNKFEESLANYTGAKYAISTVNGTAALHISLMLSGVEANDYVIVPNITFIASLNSIKYCNANPILMDVKEDSWQMDLDLLEEFLTKSTIISGNKCLLKKNKKRIKAIMPVHVLGNITDVDRLLKIAKRFKLAVVEDSTESLGTFYKGKHSGTHGLFGCVSFNGNKILTTGGGGMILTNNKTLAKKAKHITTQAKSHPFEYLHDDIGYNYRLVNILSAMGVAQMEQLEGFLTTKEQIAANYTKELSLIPGIVFQKMNPDAKVNNWLFTIRCKDQKGLMKFLLANNIQVRPFWVPMNKLKMFKKDLYITKDKISEKVYKSCVSLPCSTNLKPEEQAFVISKIKEFYKK
ncbi:MAG: LegC family aminotransferase [Sphingobacteriaceae bacterium]|nr:LegC family aminotransferase [Sphingobacteriaceae bacterium]